MADTSIRRLTQALALVESKRSQYILTIDNSCQTTFARVRVSVRAWHWCLSISQSPKSALSVAFRTSLKLPVDPMQLAWRTRRLEKSVMTLCPSPCREGQEIPYMPPCLRRDIIELLLLSENGSPRRGMKVMYSNSGTARRHWKIKQITPH